MQDMFRSASAFNQPLEQWNVGNVTNMQGMFCCATVFNQPLDQWNVSNVIRIQAMFSNASAFNKPLANWNVGNVTYMIDIFSGASAFNQPIGQWNVSNVITMLRMFAGASAFDQPLEQWNVGTVTDMRSMFSGASSFNQPLEQWDVKNVTNMESMFYDASSFDQDISHWNTTNVTNMGIMFEGASVFNQDIRYWIVDSSTTLSNMFAPPCGMNPNTYGFTVPTPLYTEFNVQRPFIDGLASTVGTLNWGISLYLNANGSKNTTGQWTTFYQAVYGTTMNDWDISLITTLADTFYNKTLFNEDISNWIVSNVTTFYRTFANTSFSGNLSLWGVSSSATTLESMFQASKITVLDVSTWDLTSVSTLSLMITDSRLTPENYGNFLISLNNNATLQNDLILGITGVIYLSDNASVVTAYDSLTKPVVDGGKNMTIDSVENYSVAELNEFNASKIELNASTTNKIANVGKTTYFFDSGGPEYANSNNENYNITLLPGGKFSTITLEGTSWLNTDTTLKIFSSKESTVPLVDTSSITPTPISLTGSKFYVTFQTNSTAVRNTGFNIKITLSGLKLPCGLRNYGFSVKQILAFGYTPCQILDSPCGFTPADLVRAGVPPHQICRYSDYFNF
jgi:surface protein